MAQPHGREARCPGPADGSCGQGMGCGPGRSCGAWLAAQSFPGLRTRWTKLSNPLVLSPPNKCPIPPPSPRSPPESRLMETLQRLRHSEPFPESSKKRRRPADKGSLGRRGGLGRVQSKTGRSAPHLCPPAPPLRRHVPLLGTHTPVPPWLRCHPQKLKGTLSFQAWCPPE